MIKGSKQAAILPSSSAIFRAPTWRSSQMVSGKAEIAPRLVARRKKPSSMSVMLMAIFKSASRDAQLPMFKPNAKNRHRAA